MSQEQYLMVMRLLKIIFFTAMAVGLGACNYLTGDTGVFRDRGGDYLEAEILPQMQIPQELDSYTIDQLYVIPEQLFTSAEVFEEIPMPDPIEATRRQGVIIQSLVNKRWIVLDATPSQVWPLIRDYWTELQIVLDYENPGSGIMETAWLEVDSDQETRHKYRIMIEPGLHSGYSEIYVTHLQNLRSDPVPTVITWPEESSSADLEREVMTSVSQYLADRNDVYQASSASLLAGSIEAERKANIIETDGGEHVLELRVSYDRAWVQIRQAIEAAGIVIVDSDRDQSFFNVRFAGIMEEDDEGGFITRLFGRGDEQMAAEEKGFSVRLMETDTTINVVTEALESTDDETRLTVELLQVINDNLS